MTREEAINELQNNKQDYTYIMTDDAIDMAIKALSAEPCEDCISRKAILSRFEHINEVYTFISIGDLMKVIGDMPSVQPKPKTGHWIEKDGFDGDTYYDCSECGESWTTIEGNPWNNGMKYCPNCGAKMESEEV